MVSSTVDASGISIRQRAAPNLPTHILPPRPPSPILNHAHLSPQTKVGNLAAPLEDLYVSDRPTPAIAQTIPSLSNNDLGFSGRDKGKGKAVDPESKETIDSYDELGTTERRQGVKIHPEELYYRTYSSEAEDLGHLMRLVEEELSEPYNIYTFRYFLIEWPHLAFLVFSSQESKVPIGTIICKQDSHRGKTNRGYIAMLSVDRAWRRRGIARTLIGMAIAEMTKRGAHEIVLETECDNETSLALYDSLGFLREKRLMRFYSNGKDAYRLIRALPNHPYLQEESEEEAENARWDVGSGPDWLADLDEDEAMYRGLGGPAVSNKQAGVGEGGEPIPRSGTPIPGAGGWKPESPPRPSSVWDSIYT